MIPRRLRLKGFMCYRDDIEISFRGPSTWVLYGPNGAGKSALLDAMVYALYGEHRLGRQKDQELIHHQENELLVEFDFAIGDDEYRVKRTYSRKQKKGSVLAMHLHGPNAPDLTRTGEQVMPPTGSEGGLKEWVDRIIGLDSRTFTFSILLQQGKSDALLKSGGAERHRMLAQIIDLSPYERLYLRATGCQKDYARDVEQYGKQLDSLEMVDESLIVSVVQQVDEAQARKEEARQHQLILASLKVQAEQWHKLQKEQCDLEMALARCEDVLTRADQIERDASRRQTLQMVTPFLRQIYSKQGECHQLLETIGQLQVQVQECLDRSSQVTEQQRAMQKCIDGLERELTDLRSKQNDLQQRLLQLSPVIQKIEDFEERKKRLQMLDQQLSAYPEDLEVQQTRLLQELDRLGTIETALSLLQSFAEARHQWLQHTRQLIKMTQQFAEQNEAFDQAADRRLALVNESEKLDKQLGDLREEVARKQTIKEECQKRFKRFLSIDGQAKCSYCGQPLTAEHLAIERQRVRDELQQAEEAYKAVVAQRDGVQQQLDTLEIQLDEAKREELKFQKVLKELEEQKNTVKSEQHKAASQADAVLRLLAPDHLSHIQGTGDVPAELEVCLQAIYPTDQDLQGLDAQLQGKESLEEKLKAVEDDLRLRGDLARERDFVLRDIRQFNQAYPDAHTEALLQEYQSAQQMSTHVNKQLGKYDRDLTGKRQELKSIGGILLEAAQEHSRLQQEIAVAQTNLSNAKQAIEEKCISLPAEWQRQTMDLSEAALLTWEQEIETLQGAEEALQALQDARQNRQRYQERLEVLQKEGARIPVEARRPPVEIEKEAEQADECYQRFEKQEQDVRAEVSRLKELQNQRRKLEQQLAQAARKAYLYKELARLLGRDCLQHYLLQKAEEGIVTHANEELDRISGGMLRLELKSGTDKGGKALELVAYNREISPLIPQSVDLLSGSQQFRVAVSLALGVGRYAGHENSKVESVIIDEGFGSLDEKGRRDMIQAIRDLKDALKCIIVVSHQSEFFDEFENKYQFELVDGSTRISLV